MILSYRLNSAKLSKRGRGTEEAHTNYIVPEGFKQFLSPNNCKRNASLFKGVH